MAQKITRKHQLEASIHGGFIIPGTAVINKDRESESNYEFSTYCYIQEPDTRNILLKMKESTVTRLIADFFTSRKLMDLGYYVNVAGNVEFTDQGKQFSILVTDFTLNYPDPIEIPEFVEAQLNNTGKDRQNSSLDDDILIRETKFGISAAGMIKEQSQLVTDAKDILFNFDDFDTGASDDYYDDSIGPTSEGGLVSPESLDINSNSTVQLQEDTRSQKKIVSEENAVKCNNISLEENKEISKSPKRLLCSHSEKDLMEQEEFALSDEYIEIFYNEIETNEILQGDLHTLQNPLQDNIELKKNHMDTKTMVYESSGNLIDANEMEEEIIIQQADIQPITGHGQPTTIIDTPTIDEHVQQAALPDIPNIKNQGSLTIFDTSPIEHREQTALPDTPFIEHGEKITIPNTKIKKIVRQAQQVNSIQQNLLTVDQNNNTTTITQPRKKRRRIRYAIPGVPPRRSLRLATKPRLQYYPRKRNRIMRRKNPQQLQGQQN